MGHVILWPKPENRPSRPSPDIDGPKGQLLLYLGVRYERHDVDGRTPATAGPVKAERATRRRKRG